MKTAKGTDLPILKLRGKDYLEVKYRLVWFREEHPDWSIETELLSVTDVSAYTKATIKDEKGRTIATSHKFENVKGFPDFIEKSETGSIGRALALIGYGTQFCADELDEGDRIVDSPAQNQKSKSSKSQDASSEFENDKLAHDPGLYEFTFGKFKGQRLKDINGHELDSYINYIFDESQKKGKSIEGKVKEAVEFTDAYLKTLEFKR